ncbi:MAG: hypothetical protein NC210_06130 [[Clostridium] fimetarium]|nr:hypothetical protein [Alistipes timonensis]MCM1405981.1 hypothetical protein [[Clostridium] fimetarium]
MKKYLFLLTAFLGSLTAFAAKEAKDCENLTPYWDFNNAETAPQAGMWNHTSANWDMSQASLDAVKTQDRTNGYIVAGGGGPRTAADLADFNRAFNLIDLGGRIGKVLCFTFPQSNFQQELQNRGYDVELTARKTTNWVANANMFLFPNPEIFANKQNAYRCRIEFNMYRDEYKESPVFVASMRKLGVDDVKHGNVNTQSNRIPTSTFFENDAWDMDKWMVYDFPISQEYMTEDAALRFDFTGDGTNLVVLIKSIKIYSPYEAGEEVPTPTLDELTSNFKNYGLTPFEKLEKADTDMVPADFYSEFWFNSRESDLPVFFDAQAPYQCAGDHYIKVKGDNEWLDGAIGIGYGVGGTDQTSAVDENRAAKLFEGVSKVDFGGSCGPVFVINNNKSTLGDELAEMIGYELPKSATAVTPNSITFFPTAVESAANNYKVRFELNIYAPGAKGSYSVLPRTLNKHDVTTNTDKASVLTSDYFLDENGEWTPNQWVAYEFTTPSMIGTDPITLKTSLGKLDNAALLIRNIAVYPCDASDMAADGKGVYLPFKAIEHTVGKVEFPINVHPEDQEKVPADGDKYLWGHKIRYNVPENYDLYYKIKHDETTCTHKNHQTAAPESRAAAEDEWVKHDTNEYTYAVPEPGHTEILSLKAVNRVTQREFAMEPITVAADPILTGIEVVDADRFEGAVELYNLQGVKVDPATAAPGVYVERRGAATRKVVK